MSLVLLLLALTKIKTNKQTNKEVLMLTSKSGIGSEAYFTPEFEEILNIHLETDFPGESGDIQFYFNSKNQSENEPKAFDVTMFHAFKINITDKNGETKETTRNVQTPLLKNTIKEIVSQCKNLIAQKNKQINCEHKWIRPLDSYGSTIQTGSGKCSVCDVNGENVLPTIRTEYPECKSPDYVTQNPWGKHTFTQCGKNGLVLGRDKDNSYETAFFEAFPDVGGTSIFLRGEGDGIFDAEQDAWAKYSKIMKCENHDFTRFVYGEERDDGYARCKKCNLTGGFLKPKNNCVVCEKPTKNKVLDNFVCLVHEHLQPKDEYIKNAIKKLEEQFVHRGKHSSLTIEEFIYDGVFRALLCYPMYINAIEQLGDNDFEKHYRIISHFINTIYHAFKGNCLGVRPFRSIKESLKVKKHDVDLVRKHFSENLFNYIQKHALHTLDEDFTIYLLPDELIKKR